MYQFSKFFQHGNFYVCSWTTYLQKGVYIFPDNGYVLLTVGFWFIY